jgi:hypothetical protein
MNYKEQLIEFIKNLTEEEAEKLKNELSKYGENLVPRTKNHNISQYGCKGLFTDT